MRSAVHLQNFLENSGTGSFEQIQLSEKTCFFISMKFKKSPAEKC
jgi:hypothetical protein